MFQKLGSVVARHWWSLLIGWGIALAAVQMYAPAWESVIQDGEFAYLPDDSPSRRAEDLFGEAFSRDLLGSSVVIVVRRESREEGLTTASDGDDDGRVNGYRNDYDFVESVLRPELEELARQHGGLADDQSAVADAESSADPDEQDPAAEKPVIGRVRTYADGAIGDLLKSHDNKATLVIVELTSGFLEKRNRPVIRAIEQLIGTSTEPGPLRDRDLPKIERMPPGLDLKMSGSATVGRDMRLAAEESVEATHIATVLLVVILLLIIYRAPVLVLIPMLTVGVSVHVASQCLAMLASAEIIGLFSGVKIYIVVVLYGAGIDYCMFLIARYKEELDGGATIDEALANSVGKVGAALAASAGTTMCGIGMLAFAQFGKLQQAGISMSLSLVFVLTAALTFTPALLRLVGRWAFWPRMRSEHIAAPVGWVSPTRMIARLIEQLERHWLRDIWDRVGALLLARPATVWVASILLLMPFVVIAVMFYNNLSYGLLAELPQDRPSVIGAEAVQTHFPAGVTGPVSILVENPSVDFREPRAWLAVEEFTERISKLDDSLGIADVRSVARPLGARGEEQLDELSPALRAIRSKVMRKRGVPHYVSDRGELAGHVTRIDVIFERDPFSRDSIAQFEKFRREANRLIPAELDGGEAGEPDADQAELLFFGPTPSIRDLKVVTNADQVRIDILVVAGVFAILVMLLRRVAIAGYLIVSVFFSYLVTLGVTFTVFWALDPAGFAGLDWKVPLFLFTILIAVGEDYNIYLITRIDEEQVRHGPVQGIIVALSKTGSIISGCGIIMAGTFSSLLVGSLVGVKQLGFALAFGVLLDTFVVRPILVPAYLVLLHSGRFGPLGKLLGAQALGDDSPLSAHASAAVARGDGSGSNGQSDHNQPVPEHIDS